MRFKWLLLLPVMLLAKEPFQEPWGKDAHLVKPPVQEESENNSVSFKIADAIIRFHQEVISPVAGSSHFRPTSSKYMQLAMQRYGFFKGFIMGCDRLLRETNEEWVYRTVRIDGKVYKYDPAWSDKYHPTALDPNLIH